MSNLERRPRRFFVSGMMRSGTTLLQKALDAHPSVRVHYQSSTEYLIGIKERFLSERCNADYHTLCHYNPPSAYAFAEFRNWQIKMVGTEGGWFPNLADEACEICGVKEVLCEEFYPAFLDENVRCINIIRDPRDVIASMSFGDGVAFTGKARPVLFDLRNWRKSVHFSTRLNSNPRFKSLFFEDLIVDPANVLDELFDWLNVGRVSIQRIEENIRGDKWLGNSSFVDREPFDRLAIGGYKSSVPSSVISFIEAVCFPEMRHLGYDVPERTEAARRTIIEGYEDPFVVDRVEFDPSYSSSVENRLYETGRLGRDFFDLNKDIFE